MTSLTDLINLRKPFYVKEEKLISFATAQQKALRDEWLTETETQKALADFQRLLVETEAWLTQVKAKSVARLVERHLAAEKEKSNDEARLLQEKTLADLALENKQADITKESDEHLQEEKSLEFSLKIKMTEPEELKHAKQL